MNLCRVARVDVPPKAWDAFVDAHPSGWHFHRAGWLDYGLALGGDREDLSFAVVDDAGEIVGICPLIREGDRCAFEGEPGAWPLVTDIESATESFWGIKATGLPATFRSCPLVNAPSAAEDLTVAWRSRVVDLRQSATALHAGLRKSYKALVNITERSCRIVGPGDGIGPGDFEAVHRASVGLVAPRPAAFYTYYARLIGEGRAFLAGARARDGGSAAGSPAGPSEGSSPSPSTIPSWGAVAFIFTGKGGAYYGSGPSLVPGTMHAVLWRAILEAKAMGLARFELGWRGHATTEKERGVEHFKAGFGGADVPVWVLEVM